MKPTFQAIQIGTLATWMSVASVGLIGLRFTPVLPLPSTPTPGNRPSFTQEIILGGPQPPTPTGDIPSQFPEPSPSFDSLPDSPPPLAQAADPPPLPEIPAISEPAVSPEASASEPTPVTMKRAAARPSRAPTARANRGNSSPSKIRSTTEKSTSNGTSSGVSSTAGDAARIANGSMPAPPYPPEARRLGQSGTVIIEFTVDPAGVVIDTLVKSSSSSPLLDHEAVRTVRRWKFPPGSGIMKLERPIAFKIR